MQTTIVVALGGNAILKPGEKGTAELQMANVQATCRSIVQLVKRGYRVVITHGNGPQVGNILIQNLHARGIVPAMPLDVCGAESQGLIGYMIQQAMHNELIREGLQSSAITVLTQVVVDSNDPAFGNPTKPIGPFHTEEEAKRFMAEKGEMWKEDAGRGWRKVVPSPQPVQIFERRAIESLLDRGEVVIAAGGGGIPVVREGGMLRGVEAVIDKDLASAKLAMDIGADVLLILTDVEKVALNYRTPSQVFLDSMTIDEARRYMAEGHFRAGSMGPKVQASINFASAGGLAIIASLGRCLDALDGKSGTRISR
ncbi:MAG: carbamate kinase [Bacillota bacterium]